MSGYDEPPPTPSGRWDAPAEFDEFVRSRHAALLRFVHLRTGDPHAAADLVQEALEKAGLRWRRIRQQDAPESYVRRSMLNAHINHGRRRRRERLVAEAPERGGAVAEPRDDALWRLLATRNRTTGDRHRQQLSAWSAADPLCRCSAGACRGRRAEAGHDAGRNVRAAVDGQWSRPARPGTLANPGWDVLTVTLELPESVRIGQTLVYVVVMANPSGVPVARWEW